MERARRKNGWEKAARYCKDLQMFWKKKRGQTDERMDTITGKVPNAYRRRCNYAGRLEENETDQFSQTTSTF